MATIFQSKLDSECLSLMKFDEPIEYFLFIKGAAELIFSYCNRYLDAKGMVV